MPMGINGPIIAPLSFSFPAASMGSVVGKAMEKNFEKQQEFMLELNRVTVERQIQMQNQMRERMQAMQMARAREMFAWLASFYALATVGMVAGYRRTGKPSALAPVLPLSFVLAYQADLAYGSKMERIRGEAENILMFESDLVDSPAGLPTVASLDVARAQQAENAKYKAIASTADN